MRTVLSISALSAIVAVLGAGGWWRRSDAAPAEGLTPFGFLMARAYGEPAVHPVMRLIAFKPGDGAKFRETFEKKHGPKGRDLIDSLGRGSYKTEAKEPEAAATDLLPAATGNKSTTVKNPLEPFRSKRWFGTKRVN